jgi:mono/diheme cytochrome c family protein
MKRIPLVLLLPIFLTACEFSLAGDITPPPATEMAATAPIESPSQVPDPVAGEPIYVTNCAPCHGVGGLGDGEVASQLRFPPTAIGDPEISSLAIPNSWFGTVTSGRLDASMPPFSGVLTAQQRWDALAYVFSLSQVEEQISRGAELFVVHEEPIRAEFLQLDEFEFVSDYSRADLARGLNELLPVLEDSEAVAAYVQAKAFGFAEAMVGSPAVPSGETATFVGRVVDGTDGILPADLEAVIFGYDHDVLAFSATIPIDAQGNFDFPNVPFVGDWIYFVSVDYLGLSYFSEFISSSEDGTDFGIPITIYETTSDTSELAVEVVQLVFEFSDPGVVRLVERIEITNLGDRAVTPGADGVPVLRFSLPANASDLQFEDGELGDRYVAVEGGFGDLRAVLPGQSGYQILFAYDLPYRSGLNLQVPLDLPTRAILALVPEGQIEVEGSAFQLLSTQQIDNTNYAAYLAEGGFTPEDAIDIALRGRHPLGGGGLQAVLADDRLTIGLAALTVTVGIAWLWLRRIGGAMPQTAEQIMDEIIALDDAYEKANIKQVTYETRRAVLRERLRIIVEKSKK